MRRSRGKGPVRAKKKVRGSVMVETAIVLPLFLFLMTAGVDFALKSFVHASFSSAMDSFIREQQERLTDPNITSSWTLEPFEDVRSRALAHVEDKAVAAWDDYCRENLRDAAARPFFSRVVLYRDGAAGLSPVDNGTTPVAIQYGFTCDYASLVPGLSSMVGVDVVPPPPAMTIGIIPVRSVALAGGG